MVLKLYNKLPNQILEINDIASLKSVYLICLLVKHIIKLVIT